MQLNDLFCITVPVVCLFFFLRPAPSSFVFSPPTVVDTTDQMNSPVGMFPPVSCRYTHGEAILFTCIWETSSFIGIDRKKYCNHIWGMWRKFVHWLFSHFRMDATLKELTSLVKEVYPEARKKGTHFSFNIVYPDPRGKMYRFVLYYNKIGYHQYLEIPSCEG